jgi:hypothetical protein
LDVFDEAIPKRILTNEKWSAYVWLRLVTWLTNNQLVIFHWFSLVKALGGLVIGVAIIG